MPNRLGVEMEENPVDLLFGGMKKLGPGDDAITLRVLKSLPNKKFSLVVDAGCGTGRQTLVLARELKSKIHAVDNYGPFLSDLVEDAKKDNADGFIETHCMDIAKIPDNFKNIDLLWSEGAAYNIGFSNALSLWSQAMSPQGLVVVSELTWLSNAIPARVKEFFDMGYPDMKKNEENVHLAEALGYSVVDTVVLPPSSWIEGYYELLEPKAKSLISHESSDVRSFAEETIEEIEVFKISEGSYGYVFYVLQAPELPMKSRHRSNQEV